jgi:hypothetical protein
MAAPKGIVLKTTERPYGGVKLSRQLRTRKMIRPICPEHFPQNGYIAKKSGWADYCIAQGHEPYVTVHEVETKRPILEERDGKTFKTGESIEIEYVKNYNWEEVPDEVSYASGRAVADSLERGWKFPEDFGFARFCDFKGCSIQSPKFRGPNGGLYHERNEAAIMILRDDETAIFVAQEKKARAAQLAEVNVEKIA